MPMRLRVERYYWLPQWRAYVAQHLYLRVLGAADKSYG
jgi:hypothetical protein